MKRFLWFLPLLLLAACTKEDLFKNDLKGVWVSYTIQKGAQSADQAKTQPVTLDSLRFIVQFDNSARYTTVSPSNQSDINKLYGFSDNNKQHHEFSARIGWRWFNNQLELLGYNYNNSVNDWRFITAVPLNTEIPCSIKVSGNQYIINVNGVTVSMPRAATTPKAEGYKLFPFFGGTENAPQLITIKIKEL